MPSLWLANGDECFHLGHDQEKVLLKKLEHTSSRFLLCLEDEDILITPVPVSSDFISYMSSITGANFHILSPSSLTTPYSLVDSIIADAQLLNKLQTLLSHKQDWKLEPYIETEKTTALAKGLNIQTKQTEFSRITDGLISRLNNKAEFKELMCHLGIPSVPGKKANTLEEISTAIKQQSGYVMLRKTFAAGGMGNLSGTNTDLINSLDKWYDGGTVLIEPFLDFTAIIGSLVTLTDSGCIYRGLDLQLVRNNSWSGLRYPVANSHIAAQIKHASMIAAESVHALGARGNMNIDWGVLKNKDDSETPMALECNFRHNGFSHLLNFGLNRFKSLQDLHILYEENIKIGDERTTFSDMMEKLSPLLVKSKKSPRGILPIGPPNRGLCNIAIFEPTAESIDNTYSCLKALTSI